MKIDLRPLGAHDLPEVDRIFRLAFGTFLGVPEPQSFMGDADMINARWRTVPAASLGAYGDGAHVIKDQNFHFVRPLIGFETFAKGKCIAIDGADEIRAPCDDCTVFMPARTVIVGREAVYLTRPMP